MISKKEYRKLFNAFVKEAEHCVSRAIDVYFADTEVDSKLGFGKTTVAAANYPKAVIKEAFSKLFIPMEESNKKGVKSCMKHCSKESNQPTFH